MRLFFILTLVLLLSFRFFFYYSSLPVYKSGDKINISYTFLDDPKTLFGRASVRVNGATILFQKGEEFSYGDRVEIQGIVLEKTFTNKKTGKQQKQLIIENPAVLRVKDGVGILSLIGFLRQKITSSFNSYLNKNEAGLLSGIVFGIKGNFDKDIIQAYKDTGVLHVIAASGANVSMVSVFLLSLFSMLVKRRVAILFTIFGILFYALFSGLAPSIVRASLMGVFAFTALLFGRQNYVVLSLLLSGFLMLFWQPEVLSDAGFQLSFLSTGGIIFIKPVLDRYLMLGKKLVIFEDITTTLSAQIATVPVMLTAFSSYSVVSLIANAMVLWTVPILMIFGGVAVIASLVVPVFAGPFLYLCYPLLLYFEKVTIFFGNLGLSFRIENIPLIFVAGYYCLLFSVIGFLSKQKKHENKN